MRLPFWRLFHYVEASVVGAQQLSVFFDHANDWQVAESLATRFDTLDQTLHRPPVCEFGMYGALSEEHFPDVDSSGHVAAHFDGQNLSATDWTGGFHVTGFDGFSSLSQLLYSSSLPCPNAASQPRTDRLIIIPHVFGLETPSLSKKAWKSASCGLRVLKKSIDFRPKSYFFSQFGIVLKSKN